MKLAELVLRYRVNKKWDDGDYVGMEKNSKVCFCAGGFIDEIRRMFDFPEKPPKRVWLTLHSRPSMFREELQVCEWGSMPNAAILKKGKYTVGGDVETDKVLFPFIGKTVYLQVEYEE